jgi:hypothetical protein
MNVMGSRIIRKPHYGIEEACRRWEISEADLAGFVIEQEITLSVVVAGLAVEIGTIEEVDDDNWCSIPEGRRHLSGAFDLHPINAWSILTQGSQIIRSFKVTGNGYITIEGRDYEEGELHVVRSQLIVRHAELVRFEAAQDQLAATVETAVPEVKVVPNPRGAPAKYKWDDFYCALAVMTHADGVPETQTELIRRMMDWFAKQNLYPDPTTVKRKVAIFWRQYHEAIAHNPA